MSSRDKSSATWVLGLSSLLRAGVEMSCWREEDELDEEEERKGRFLSMVSSVMRQERGSQRTLHLPISQAFGVQQASTNVHRAGRGNHVRLRSRPTSHRLVYCNYLCTCTKQTILFLHSLTLIDFDFVLSYCTPTSLPPPHTHRHHMSTRLQMPCA
jgi:hypothetical protein